MAFSLNMYFFVTSLLVCLSLVMPLYGGKQKNASKGSIIFKMCTYLARVYGDG